MITIPSKMPGSWIIGIETIDEQHQELWSLIHGCDTGNHPEIDTACDCFQQFLGLLFEHFQAEEAIMRDIGFPGLTEHQMFHKEALSKLNDSSLAKEDQQSLALDLLIANVIEHDLTFQAYLLDTGKLAVDRSQSTPRLVWPGNKVQAA